MSLSSTAIKAQYCRPLTCISQVCRYSQILKFFEGLRSEGTGNLCDSLVHNLLLRPVFLKNLKVICSDIGTKNYKQNIAFRCCHMQLHI
jgi:hypothetical protein